MSTELTNTYKCTNTLDDYSLYRSPNVIMVIRSLGNITRIGEGRSPLKILIGKLAEMRPLARLRCKRKNNIRGDFKEISSSQVTDIWDHF